VNNIIYANYNSREISLLARCDQMTHSDRRRPSKEGAVERDHLKNTQRDVRTSRLQHRTLFDGT
jgi:hypothetical protein